jgi:tubulin monoglycylase TTLL3/8
MSSFGKEDASEFTFFADDKFEEVIDVLQARGWHRKTERREQQSCRLLWTNLRNVTWDEVVDDTQIVNHLRGSQHLSNKSFLAFHLDATGGGCRTHMPMQWSASYQDLAELVGMALLSCLYGHCLTMLDAPTQASDVEGEGDSQRDETLRDKLKLLAQVQRALLMDKEWAASPCADLVRLLIVRLSAADTGAADPVALSECKAAVEARSGCRGFYGSNDTWIVKPVGLSCGEDIRLCRGLHALLLQVEAMEHKCVVQRYVERPLLVRERRKFDIRQWVLVTGVEPVAVHGFSEFYARLSGKPFALEGSSLDDRVVHLCNNAVQATAQGYRDGLTAEDAAETVCDTMMSMAQLRSELERQGHDGRSALDAVVAQMKRICVDTVLSVRDKLQRVGAGFEWLGFDFIVTEDLHVLMLECNVSPDISRSTGITARLVQHGVRDLFRLLLGETQTEPRSGKVSDSPSPQWELWHGKGNEIGTSTAIEASSRGLGAELCPLQFARLKREHGVLRTGDYSPQKLPVLQRVHAILNAKQQQESTKHSVSGAADTGGGGVEDEGEEDEL